MPSAGICTLPPPSPTPASRLLSSAGCASPSSSSASSSPSQVLPEKYMKENISSYLHLLVGLSIQISNIDINPQYHVFTCNTLTSDSLRDLQFVACCLFRPFFLTWSIFKVIMASTTLSTWLVSSSLTSSNYRCVIIIICKTYMACSLSRGVKMMSLRKFYKSEEISFSVTPLIFTISAQSWFIGSSSRHALTVSSSEKCYNCQNYLLNCLLFLVIMILIFIKVILNDIEYTPPCRQQPVQAASSATKSNHETAENQD